MTGGHLPQHRVYQIYSRQWSESNITVVQWDCYVVLVWHSRTWKWKSLGFLFR